MLTFEKFQKIELKKAQKWAVFCLTKHTFPYIIQPESIKLNKKGGVDMNSLKHIKERSDLVTIIPLADSENDFAVVAPNKIVFALDASEKELDDLVKQEEENLSENLSDYVLKGPYNHFPSAITFLPTMDCNLHCEYCYARGGESKDYMTFNTATDMLDIIADSNGVDEMTLTFAGGGEPFLNFEVMKQTCSYTKKIFNKVFLRVITNGTFNKEQLEWITDNDVSTRISFDGVAQGKQRPFADGSSSLKAVENNILRLVEKQRPPIVQCIVTRESVSNLKETLDYLAELGVEVVKIEPVHISPISRGNNDLSVNPGKFVSELLEAIEHIAREDLNLKLDMQFFSKPSAMPYCNADGRNITVNPKGLVSSCVEITRRSDPHSFPFLYGKIQSNKEKKLLVDEKAIENLSKFHFTNYGRCANCKFKLLCGGGCPVKNVWDSGSPLKPSNYICKVEHLLLPKLLSLIANSEKIRNILVDQASIEC